MAALYKMGEKARATLILVASIFALLNQAVQSLVKIFDDSELTIAEATFFISEQGQAVHGVWKDGVRG